MKVFRVSLMLIVVLALLGLGTMRASAAPYPPDAPFVDNQVHTIGPNGTMWFRFTYDGSERSPVIVRMPALAGEGISLAITHPMGLVVGAGSDEQGNLIWSGGDGVKGTYYLQVQNNNPAAMDFQLIVEGTGVQAAPNVVAPIVVNPGKDAGQAKALDGALRSMAPNSSYWYKYTFGGDSNLALTLTNGSASGMELRVFTSNQAANWWSETPIGVGGKVINDLVWSGSMPNGETIYIEVVNDNPYPSNYTLLYETVRLVE